MEMRRSMYWISSSLAATWSSSSLILPWSKAKSYLRSPNSTAISFCNKPHHFHHGIFSGRFSGRYLFWKVSWKVSVTGCDARAEGEAVKDSTEESDTACDTRRLLVGLVSSVSEGLSRGCIISHTEVCRSEPPPPALAPPPPLPAAPGTRPEPDCCHPSARAADLSRLAGPRCWDDGGPRHVSGSSSLTCYFFILHCR